MSDFTGPLVRYFWLVIKLVLSHLKSSTFKYTCLLDFDSRRSWHGSEFDHVVQRYATSILEIQFCIFNFRFWQVIDGLSKMKLVFRHETKFVPC